MKTFKVFVFVLAFILVAVHPVHADDYDVVIAREDIPAEFMVAQVYAQSVSLPIIGVSKSGFTPLIEREFLNYAQQGYGNALIIGGAEAVSPEIEKKLVSMNYTVSRIWDWDRYGTAARVAISLWNESNIVVVSPADIEGTLIYSARVAINYKSPLLLTKSNEIPEETKTAIHSLKALRIIIVGNISENVKKELSSVGNIEQTKFFSNEKGVEKSQAGFFLVGVAAGALAILLISGFFGFKFLKKRTEVPYEVLQEDEQKLVDVIQENDGIIKQEALPEKTSFSRPKVSRLVAELEKRGIIKREKAGKTRVVKIVKTVVK